MSDTIRFVKGKKKCSMGNCKEPAKVADFCAACYSWWQRVRWLDPPDFARYLRTAQYRNGRMSARLDSPWSGIERIKYRNTHKRRSKSA